MGIPSIETFTGEVPGASDPRVSLDPSIPGSLDPSIPRIPRFRDLSIPRFLDSLMQDRQKSVDKGAREGPRCDFGSNLDDFRSTLRSIFVVFRGNVARVVQLAARIAEPLILPTGAVLWRGHGLYEKPPNCKKSTEIRADSASQKSRAEKLAFCVPGRDLASILTAPKRCRALSGTLPGIPCHFRGPSKQPRGALGSSERLPRRSWDAFQTPLGATGRPERVPGSI